MTFSSDDALAKHALLHFSASEWGEVIWNVYRFLGRAIRRGTCDMLTVTPTHFIWSRDGTIVSTFEITRLPIQSIGYDEALRMILERDELFSQHVQLVSATQESAIYSIVPDLPMD